MYKDLKAVLPNYRLFTYDGQFAFHLSVMQGDRQSEIARMHEKFIVESSTKRIILHYCIFQYISMQRRVGGWAHCLSPCITDQWNANYPSSGIPSHCFATESRQYKTSKQDDERSITIQFLNGWTKPNILYIPLIILKFTYNGCNKVKIYKVSFIDYMFIIMFSESISTFLGTSLQNFRIWNTNLFCLTGCGGTG